MTDFEIHMRDVYALLPGHSSFILQVMFGTHDMEPACFWTPEGNVLRATPPGCSTQEVEFHLETPLVGFETLFLACVDAINVRRRALRAAGLPLQ